MNRLLDKAVLLLLCAVLYLQNAKDDYAVAWILIVIIIGASMSLFVRNWQRQTLFIVYLAVCTLAPHAVLLLPMVCYDLFAVEKKCLIGFSVLPLAHAWPYIGMGMTAWVLLLGLLSYLTQRRTSTFESTAEKALSMQDDARENALRFKHKNRELMEKQEYEIRLATLTERNRISRDIHDTVGHLLSSAILQIGALMTVTQELPLQKSLETLKDTLSSGMDSIRSDLHNLHDQSLDLKIEAEKLARSFAFCPVELEYDWVNNPPSQVQYTLLFVLKEALANVMKHSNATGVHVLLREHPGFYQLIVQDNGHGCPNVRYTGLGLQNIAERVESLNGRVRFGGNGGFTVFISLPKGAGHEGIDCR